LVSVDQDSVVRVWDMGGAAAEPSSSRPLVATTAVPLQWAAFSRDGNTVAAGGGSQAAVVLDTATNQGKVFRFAGAGVISPDGRTLIVCNSFPVLFLGGPANLFDAPSGRRLRGLKGDWMERPRCMTVSPDGKWVTTVPEFGLGELAKVWDVATGAPVVTLSQTDRSGDAECTAFSPDGMTLAIGGEDWLTLYAAGTWAECGTLKVPGTASAMAFSPDGRTLAAITTRATPHRPSRQLTSLVRPQNLQPDEVTVWDLSTGTATATLKGHAGPVNCLAFAPDSKTLATGSDDRSVRLWHVGTGQEMARPEGIKNPVVGVHFHPDGRTLSAIEFDGTILRWQAAPAEQAARQ
jgi:WD40 repeat protein